MVVNTEKESIDNNRKHDNVLKCLRLHYSKTLESETIYWLNWNDFCVGVYEQSLNFDPLLLLMTKIIRSLPLLNLLIEFIDDDRDKQIHDKECRHENVEYVEETDGGEVLLPRRLIISNCINGRKHHIRPHFERGNFKECHHRNEDVIVAVEWLNPYPLHLLRLNDHTRQIFMRQRIRLIPHICILQRLFAYRLHISKSV